MMKQSSVNQEVMDAMQPDLQNDIKYLFNNFGRNCYDFSVSSITSATGEGSEMYLSETTGTVTDDTIHAVYKMKAHRVAGENSPKRIEFYQQPKHARAIPSKKKFIKRKHFTHLPELGHGDATVSKAPDYSNTKFELKTDNVEMINEKKTIRFTTSIINKIKSSFSGFRNSETKEINLEEEEQKDGSEKINEKQYGDDKTKNDDEKLEKDEIYYFDHGNFDYFRTTDCPPQIFSEVLAQQTTHHATRFWAEIYGSIHIGIAFMIAFILQSYRFILYSTIRPLVVGFLQMTSDYFIKPVIAIFFNGVLQPPMILFYNIFSSICAMLEPIARLIGHFLHPFGNLLKQIRLVEIHNNYDKINNNV